MSDTQDLPWFEAAWEQREEQVYRKLFGDLGPGIHPLDMSLFRDAAVDPRWLTHGVFESPPNARHDSWLYVTSGLSNAWHDEHPNAEGWSGLGRELLLETREQSPWALYLLRHFCAYQLLLAAGHFGERPLLDEWDRMRLGNPIDGSTSQLQSVLFIAAPGFAGTQQLLSGRFDFLQLVGMTPDEHNWAETEGYPQLLERLARAGASPVIDPQRAGNL